MTWFARQDAPAAVSESSRIRPRFSAILAALIVCAPFTASQAQLPLPPIDPNSSEEWIGQDPLPPVDFDPQPGKSQISPIAGVDPLAAEIELPPLPTREDWEVMLSRLDKLEKESQKAKAEKEKAKPKEKEKDGWVDVSSEKWTVRLAGQMQADYINWADASPAIVGDQDYFEFRRLRLEGVGTGYGVLDFRLQMEFAPASAPDDGITGPVVEVKDAYLTVHDLPILNQFRIGNFFVPFGLEQVTNDRFNIFLERSIPTQGIFTADREVGVASYNCTEDQNFTWTFGCFFDSLSDDLKQRIDDNQGVRVSGRVTWLPYYDAPSNGRYLIHTGAGILYTADQNNSVRFRTRPEIHLGPRLIDSGPLNSNRYTIGNIELAAVMGQLTIQSEAYLTNVNLNAGDSANLYGAYIHASYFLTGENRVYERFGQHGAQFVGITPYTNFFLVPGGHGSGAWEAKARWSMLSLSDIHKGQQNDLTAGFNWYWTDRTRVMFDWIHPFTTAQTVFGSVQADILGMRFDYTF